MSNSPSIQNAWQFRTRAWAHHPIPGLCGVRDRFLLRAQLGRSVRVFAYSSPFAQEARPYSFGVNAISRQHLAYTARESKSAMMQNPRSPQMKINSSIAIFVLRLLISLFMCVCVLFCRCDINISILTIWYSLKRSQIFCESQWRKKRRLKLSTSTVY